MTEIILALMLILQFLFFVGEESRSSKKVELLESILRELQKKNEVDVESTPSTTIYYGVVGGEDE